MGDIRVEKGIPVPSTYSTGGNGGKAAVARSMSVGDSFLVSGATSDDKQVRSWRQVFRALGFRIAARVVEGGVRIWRVS